MTKREEFIQMAAEEMRTSNPQKELVWTDVLSVMGQKNATFKQGEAALNRIIAEARSARTKLRRNMR